MKDLVLTRLDSARIALAEAKTIQDTKKILDAAHAAEIYAKRQELSAETIQYATEIKVEALRQLGLMLKQTVRATGGDAQRTRYQKGTESPPTLKEIGLDKKTSSLAQKVADLPAEQFEAVKKGLATIQQAKNGGKPHISFNSGENEWYTPKPFIESARLVMGSIDCDPASSKVANRTVKANVFFDKELNGLDKKWKGNVWLNPPYSQPEVALFSEAVSSRFESGEIKSACVLVNNATETEWFGRMARIASAICFPERRIKFIDMYGNATGAPLQGQAIIFLGSDKCHAFIKEFSKFGFVLCHPE